jgi:hypothetical protein
MEGAAVSYFRARATRARPSLGSASCLVLIEWWPAGSRVHLSDPLARRRLHHSPPVASHSPLAWPLRTARPNRDVEPPPPPRRGGGRSFFPYCCILACVHLFDLYLYYHDCDVGIESLSVLYNMVAENQKWLHIWWLRIKNGFRRPLSTQALSIALRAPGVGIVSPPRCCSTRWQ